MPNLLYENRLWSNGYEFVAGADEVGRGSFAGPVVASAVAFAPILNEKGEDVLIDDSKRLTFFQRLRADVWIRENALSWGIGEASVSEINRLGLGKASKRAFRRAIFSTNKKLEARGRSLEFLLIDAFYIPYTNGLQKNRQKPIKKGDEKSFSIAAASIIAKVYRDKLMKKLAASYPEYDWGKNKGHGTRVHREAILNYGSTKHHRKNFVETFFSSFSSSPIQ